MSSDEDFFDDVAIRQTAHRWEQTGKTWDTLFQKDGHLSSTLADGQFWESQYQKRKGELKGKVRGLVRSLVIILDLTESGLEPIDFGIPRIRLISEELSSFIVALFDQNPLCQLSIVTTFNYTAQIQTPLSSDPQVHLDFIKRLNDITTTGEPSIYNALTVATKILENVQPFSTKEVLMIYGSMNTCDPQPISDLITNVLTTNGTAPFKCIISIIGMSAEINVLRKIAEETNGTYFVPVTKEHFVDLLQAQVLPPPWNDNTQRRRFIPFGFAKSVNEKLAFDLTTIYDKASMPARTTVCCPRCKTRLVTLPIYCPCCNLLVMSPAHLTRSVQHLKPIDKFVQVKLPSDRKVACCSCNCFIDESPYMCNGCKSVYCKACNTFIHDSLQSCPGCLSLQQDITNQEKL